MGPLPGGSGRGEEMNQFVAELDMLRWGRSPEGAEEGPHDQVTDPDLPASMGPLPEGSGRGPDCQGAGRPRALMLGRPRAVVDPDVLLAVGPSVNARGRPGVGPGRPRWHP